MDSDEQAPVGSSLSATSAKLYTPFILWLYDFVVHTLSNQFAWCCSSKDVLVPFFQRYLPEGRNHLDVGVGTGYMLYHSNAQLSSYENIFLMDMNPNALAQSARRLEGSGLPPTAIHPILHDATLPWNQKPLPMFESISVFYLLHCLSGPMTDKVRTVVSALKPHLNPTSGVLYGATILGDEAHHNILGRCLMGIYNWKGVFGNRGDKEADLREALRQHFEEVDVWRRGKVALFAARKPITR